MCACGFSGAQPSAPAPAQSPATARTWPETPGFKTPERARESTKTQERAPALTGTCRATPGPSTPTYNPPGSLVRWTLSSFPQRWGLDSFCHLSRNGNHCISSFAWQLYKHGSVCPQGEGRSTGGDAPGKDTGHQRPQRGEGEATTAAGPVLPGRSSVSCSDF